MGGWFDIAFAKHPELWEGALRVFDPARIFNHVGDQEANRICSLPDYARGKTASVNRNTGAGVDGYGPAIYKKLLSLVGPGDDRKFTLLSAADTTDLPVGVVKNITLSAWISLVADGWDAFYGVGTIFAYGATGTIKLSVNGANIQFFAGGVASGTIPVSALHNGWHHITAVLGDGSVALYLNGRLYVRSTVTNGTVTTSHGMIGAEGPADFVSFKDNPFLGYIGPITFHNRILSDQEIQLLASDPRIMFEEHRTIRGTPVVPVLPNAHRYRKSVHKCSEFVSPPCDPVPTDGCCAIIPCSYCLTWTAYGFAAEYSTAEWDGTGWTGAIAGVEFRGFWEVGYESGECEFVVELDSVEVYRVSCYNGQDCRDSSDTVAASISYDDGVLVWTRVEHRELAYRIDADSYCRTFFCGDCDCSCVTLCAVLIGPDCCESKFRMTDVSYPCDGPEWSASVMCGTTPYAIALQLTRREYDDECLLVGSVNGTDLDPIVLPSCVGWTVAFFMYDGTQLQVSCDACGCDDDEPCGTGCCWPYIINDVYPCGYLLPVDFEVAAPGCVGTIDGSTGSFSPTGVPNTSYCGSCSVAPAVAIGSIVGTRYEAGPANYCQETPCIIGVSLILECQDGGVTGGLDNCCGGFRLWVGTTERFAGGDGTIPLGGSVALYWISFSPSSCSCNPLAMIFEVTLVADCPEVWPTPGPCAGSPKNCCVASCSGFTVTI